MPAFDPDLVVVGSGSSGAPIAARTTERADRSVLLLEAGPDYPPDVVLPKDLDDGTRNSWRQHDWGFRARPTPTQGMLFSFPRGKVIGGSSAVNTCIALRGLPYDYDEWASMGLPEWSFDNVLPFFKALEDDRDFGDEPYHGKGGPIPIRRHPARELGPWQAAFVEACLERGYPRCDDVNDPSTKGGVASHAMNKIDGKRQSTARCYLTREVRARPNLRVRPLTLVRRVLFDEKKRVRGIEVETNGAVEVIPAKKVALAGGALGTPGILLRSGIGPHAQVANLGVEHLVELPAVNAKLLDHPGGAIILGGDPRIHHRDQALIQAMVRYTSKGSEFPIDMQIQAGSFLPIHPRLTLPMPTMMFCIGKPRGHGRLVWRSALADARPEVHGEFLVDPDDRRKAVEAFQKIYELTMTPPMRKLARFVWPSGSILKNADEIGRWVFKSTGSGYHPCGTVPMGPEGSIDAATDSRGRVRGVEGLFVVDASLFPTVPSANTNLTALMFGERFGAWFKNGDL